MGNSAKRDMRAADTQEKRNQALDLRRRGLNYREIAKALACSLANAHKLVETAIAQIPIEAAEQVRQLELARLDKMLEGLNDSANTGDPRAVLAVVKIMERRAKYLGLDAPQQHEHAGKGGGPITVTLDEISDALAVGDANANDHGGGSIDSGPDGPQ